MDTLRERCPWDRAQTHASLMPHLVEECYEVLDALAALDGRDAAAAAYAHLQEELGDLLFQIVFHARLADEEGQFDLGDVARGVHDKLVHRHPHVFGDVDRRERGPGRLELGGDQEEREGEEQRHRGDPGGPARTDAHDQAGPQGALGRSRTVATPTRPVQPRRLGVAHPTRRGHRPAVRTTLWRATPATSSAELGELLFAVANLAQRLGVDAEQALRDRALSLRAEILAAEGVPDQQAGNR